MRSFLLLPLFLMLLPCAYAIDPGVARGTLQIGDTPVQIRHAYALLHDNAERVLGTGRELRVALVDREVPQESLAGLASLPIERLARENQVRGLLLRFDPANRRNVVVTVLLAPSAATQSLLTQTHSSVGEDIVRNFIMASNRVRGEVDEQADRASPSADMPRIDYRVEFSAPLFNEPAITADLNGKAAQDSPQARVLGRRGQAVQRVVVRGERAVAIFSNREWSKFVREGSDWRSDN